MKIYEKNTHQQRGTKGLLNHVSQFADAESRRRSMFCLESLSYSARHFGPSFHLNAGRSRVLMPLELQIEVKQFMVRQDHMSIFLYLTWLQTLKPLSDTSFACIDDMYKFYSNSTVPIEARFRRLPSEPGWLRRYGALSRGCLTIPYKTVSPQRSGLNCSELGLTFQTSLIIRISLDMLSLDIDW